MKNKNGGEEEEKTREINEGVGVEEGRVLKGTH